VVNPFRCELKLILHFFLPSSILSVSVGLYIFNNTRLRASLRIQRLHEIYKHQRSTKSPLFLSLRTILTTACDTVIISIMDDIELLGWHCIFIGEIFKVSHFNVFCGVNMMGGLARGTSYLLRNAIVLRH